MNTKTSSWIWHEMDGINRTRSLKGDEEWVLRMDAQQEIKELQEQFKRLREALQKC
jgi:hypothetical protein